MRAGERADVEARDRPDAARPLTMPSHALATVLPTGETMPRPVTTTRAGQADYLSEGG